MAVSCCLPPVQSFDAANSASIRGPTFSQTGRVRAGLHAHQALQGVGDQLRIAELFAKGEGSGEPPFLPLVTLDSEARYGLDAELRWILAAPEGAAPRLALIERPSSRRSSAVSQRSKNSCSADSSPRMWRA